MSYISPPCSVMNGSLKDNYVMHKAIGKGSFGTVYLAYDKEGNQYAAKVERKSSSSRLVEEYRVYKTLHKARVGAIPKIYSFMQTSTYNIMVMDLLGNSLDAVFTKCDKKFDMGTVLKLGVDFVTIMRDLH